LDTTASATNGTLALKAAAPFRTLRRDGSDSERNASWNPELQAMHMARAPGSTLLVALQAA
jgi:hypothetical protein